MSVWRLGKDMWHASVSLRSAFSMIACISYLKVNPHSPVIRGEPVPAPLHHRSLTDPDVLSVIFCVCVCCVLRLKESDEWKICFNVYQPDSVVDFKKSNPGNRTPACVCAGKRRVCTLYWFTGSNEHLKHHSDCGWMDVLWYLVTVVIWINQLIIVLSIVQSNIKWQNALHLNVLSKVIINQNHWNLMIWWWLIHISVCFLTLIKAAIMWQQTHRGPVVIRAGQENLFSH